MYILYELALINEKTTGLNCSLAKNVNEPTDKEFYFLSYDFNNFTKRDASLSSFCCMK